MENFGYIKIAAVSPPLKVADMEYNAEKIIEFAKKAETNGAKIIVFPELSTTGYTSADLFFQRKLLEKSTESLNKIKTFSEEIKSLIIVGAPIETSGKLFNAAIVICKGKILGIVPKTYIPGYKEFYEERWFASARDLTATFFSSELLGNDIPISTDILFRFSGFPEAVLGIEICEDLWTPNPPSSYQAPHGANIIANLSASNELVGKADYRKDLVIQQSARIISAYIHSSCGVNESTTDLVFGGHAIIAENGTIIKESKRFERDGEIIYGDIDIEHLLHDRAKTTSFGESIRESPKKDFRFIEIPNFDVGRPSGRVTSLSRHIDPYPFVPQNTLELDKRSEEIFSIQTAGLAKRLESARMNKIILGLSGGLDSTLALLVAVKTCELLKLSKKNIYAFTMPGFGTSKRTKSNAKKLAEALGITLEEINILKGVTVHLAELKHKGAEDVTYQNTQARYRTMILMNKSNQLHGIVLGTGDLSEIALGWCTFNGDHISHYNVNASIPKTLVKYLVNWVSEQKEFLGAQKVLKDILATPISPELVTVRQARDKKTKIQETEKLVGPYALHDFFLYHFVRWGSSTSKILFLAKLAFQEAKLPLGSLASKSKFTEAEIKKWLKVFITRFFKNQWKRSVMPDGPKVGSVSLSPRGDWRMPSDAEVKIWLKDLK
ncbi:NAD(+) synthase [Candidatus Giovannonibacteria bacterium RIFCSPHIGHO2_02_43_13]|uniref:Glutamine-dependent NAD(+) synthetase n=1 Tax=Candidatus Giovannonibacteria bacterium RIFCSPHIGHO2_02_43_13 TaxID=1798330 RepID=A0A1F5WRA4_9BACT|nr:MAG: NAD synthetase [Parcubacteria group bacterium GW2011_GWA2_44_13]OGF74644.1 MAG: NAD(+) synthase [Candidatus Giovannonibacteria bacterium RIFCSPHIGHO2_12_FULL_44_42]OGF78199.1 MAG: NAD(+) synthase [Candidatus Giovannonibacteria bacterium RIFCSPHIGHO2_02_43_13]OGF90065.1 MAG: NAD(+) synthase [Candidatus Giovannonibacteria bacterium RIFCSPLOWO2_02_FULL_43_54]OGF96607.1 MAG: NAD(+) synthase [Candidatus Giovannonibacteria bacterium RIFCSPLOWO2_12_FULL_44_32]